MGFLDLTHLFVHLQHFKVCFKVSGTKFTYFYFKHAVQFKAFMSKSFPSFQVFQAHETMPEKVPYSEISGPYFTAFGLNTDLKHSKYGHFSSKGFRYFCWGPLDKGWFPLQDFLYIQSVKSARSVLNPEVKAHALPPLEENNKERKINTHIAHILIIFSDWVFLLRKTLDRRETLNEKLGQAGKKEENRKKRKKVIY